MDLLGETIVTLSLVAALFSVFAIRNVFEWWYKRHYRMPDWAVEVRWSEHWREGEERFTRLRAVWVCDESNRVVLHPNRRLAAAVAEGLNRSPFRAEPDAEYVAVEYWPNPGHPEAVARRGWFGQPID